MSWKRHFRVVPQKSGSPTPTQNDQGGGHGTTSSYSSYLPEVYAGHPNRIQRYYQYDDMDRDSDINAALDTIADFCTQSEEQNDRPFFINYLNENASETQVKIIEHALTNWVRLNEFKSRLWYIFRNTIKNGDCFFVRDPETAEWLWVDHYSVLLVKVDEDDGKVPDEYVVKGLDHNKQGKLATKRLDTSTYGHASTGMAQAYARPAAAGSGSFQMAGGGLDSRQRTASQQALQELCVVDAKHFIHLSLNVGMDPNWPFGGSVLEPIFKTFKQKELLEDAIIIYRVQRAPERRIFYIDVGDMQPVRAKAHLQAIKNEIHQRRIPNRTGGGSSVVDAAYNPLCLDMSTRIPLLDGRTLSITDLAAEYRAGKENWVYSCDPITGKIVPGNITWAGPTRKDARVIRLVLDNGETITCTPDHKIPVLGRGFVEAKDLTTDDALIGFSTAKTDQNRWVYDNAASSWKTSRNIVAGFFRAMAKHQEFTFLSENIGKTKTEIVHRDANLSNNDPRNLAFMNEDDAHAYRRFKNIPATSAETIEAPPQTPRLVRIEDGGTMDVGTITVDGQERWHAHHTFAVEAGIFVKNSIMEDYFFATTVEGRGSKVETLPGGDCLALDTMIPLLDGRTLSLSQIIEEHQSGKQLWAYSCHPTTGAVVPGLINWAGVTRRDATVMEIVLDNGERMVVTPDHKFPVYGRGKTAARDLTVGESLIPFNRRKHVIKEGRTGDYEQVYDNETKSWEYTHRKVAKFFRDSDLVNETVFDEKYSDSSRTTVHHIDFDRFNNAPENLTWVNYQDHYKYHSTTLNQNYGHLVRQGIKDFYAKMTDAEYEDHCSRISARISASIAQKTPEELAEFKRQSVMNLINGKASERHQWLLQNDPEWREAMAQKRSRTMKANFENGIMSRDAVSERNKILWEQGAFASSVVRQTFKFDETATEMLREFVGSKTRTMADLCQKANSDDGFLAHVRKINENSRSANTDYTNFVLKPHHLASIFKNNDTDWKSFRKAVLRDKNQNLSKSRTFATTPKMMKIVVDTFKQGNTSIPDLISTLNANQEFVSEIAVHNVENLHHLAKLEITREKLKTIIEDNGYSSWKHFKNEHMMFNHRIVSIRYLDDRIDTGTLTIDGSEIYHDHHTFALAAGVFTFNSLGEIGDLDHFSRKLSRGMKIPPSYLSLSDEGGNVQFQDGKLGAAMIQEFRFNKYCMRLQSLLAPIFDEEFKTYLRGTGVTIEEDMFEIQFNPPQNFTKYRQIELDLQQVGVYQQIADNKKLSERFKLKRFLNLTEDELLENERLWSEENAEKLKKATGTTPAESEPGANLSSVGIAPPDMGGDFSMPDEDFGDIAGGDVDAAPDTGSPAGAPPVAPPAPPPG
jgi:hypothetical protein